MAKHCASFSCPFTCSLISSVSNVMPGPRLVLSYSGASLDAIPVIEADLLEQTNVNGTESPFHGPKRQVQHPGRARRDVGRGCGRHFLRWGYLGTE